MSRNICIYQEFLTDAHKAQIQKTAEELGFAPRSTSLRRRKPAYRTAKFFTPTPRTCCAPPPPR